MADPSPAPVAESLAGRCAALGCARPRPVAVTATADEALGTYFRWAEKVNELIVRAAGAHGPEAQALGEELEAAREQRALALGALDADSPVAAD